jgi:hypothetical protein
MTSSSDGLMTPQRPSLLEITVATTRRYYTTTVAMDLLSVPTVAYDLLLQWCVCSSERRSCCSFMKFHAKSRVLLEEGRKGEMNIFRCVRIEGSQFPADHHYFTLV